MSRLGARENWPESKRRLYLDEGHCLLNLFLEELEHAQQSLLSSDGQDRAWGQFSTRLRELEDRVNLVLISGAVKGHELAQLEELRDVLRDLVLELEVSGSRSQAVGTLVGQALELGKTANSASSTLAGFRDLEAVDDASLMGVLHHVDIQDLGRALARGHCLLSERLCQLLEHEDVAIMSKAGESKELTVFEIRKAQMRVRNVLRGLVSLGRISWRRRV